MYNYLVYRAPSPILLGRDLACLNNCNYNRVLILPHIATIVITQMMLKIHEMGLGSCYVAWFDPQTLSRELQLPPDLVPVGILPCGIPSENSAPMNLHADKKPLSDITTFL